MRRLLLAIALALMSVAPAAAQSFVQETAEVFVPRIINYGTATSTSGCSVGIRGCLASTSFASATAVTITGPDADLASPPYPARVLVDLFDSGSNGTLACTAQTIEGIGAYGQLVRESMGALSESGDTTANVFRQVTSYRATGCSGGASSDVIRLSLQENELGVPVALANAAAVLSVCGTNSADTGQWYCARSGWTVTGNGFAVNLASAVWEGSFAYVDGARIRIQVTGKRPLKPL